jgi:hypothetical protein
MHIFHDWEYIEAMRTILGYRIRKRCRKCGKELIIEDVVGW